MCKLFSFAYVSFSFVIKAMDLYVTRFIIIYFKINIINRLAEYEYNINVFIASHVAYKVALHETFNTQ